MLLKSLIRIGILCIGCFLALNSMAEQVSGVRVWHAPASSRVVFDLSGPVKHELFTLRKPDRVVIDIPGALKSRALDLAEFDQGPVKNVRSAVQLDGRLRIVLDLKQQLQAKSFLLPPNNKYGHRLVVDLTKAVVSMEPTVAASVEASVERDLRPRVSDRDIVVAIDAGHGGEDPGAVGARGTLEKDVVLQISRRVYNFLKSEPGIRPILVRKGDYFLPLAERREKARQTYRADLFVSIHADSFDNKRARGASVFALSRSGATSTLARVLAERANRSDEIGGVKIQHADKMIASVIYDLAMEGSMEHSLKVGSAVLAEMGRVTELHKSAMEQAGFAVLKSPDIPSILVETGFISNLEEERKLRSPDHQIKLSRAISRGIISYFRQHPPPDTLFAQDQRRDKANERSHRIASGETLSGIAQQYKVKLGSLMRYNALSPNDVIRAGQVILIPSS